MTMSSLVPIGSLLVVGYFARRNRTPTTSVERMQLTPFPETSRLAELPYGERQFIAYANEVRAASSGGGRCDGPVVYVLSPSAMESQGISFPPGHPRPNILYVSHPCTGTLYYPAFDFHRAVFEQKFSELLTLLASLGATRVDVEARYGWGRDFAANLTLPIRNLAGTVEGNGTARQKRTEELVFSATGWARQGRPKIPSDLLWLESEPIWKAMATAELGRCRTKPSQVSWKLEYEDSFGVDASLRAHLGELSVGLGGRFERSEKTLWNVTVEFPKRSRWPFSSC